jgi:6-phosphogluconolactonase
MRRRWALRRPNFLLPRCVSRCRRAVGSSLLLLGPGKNGHTASLFPGTPAQEEQQRLVSEVSVAEEGLHQLTLTAAGINQAALVVFLVSGYSKVSILRNILEDAKDHGNIPARLIKLVHSGLLWLVDRDAASLLQP